MLLNLTRNKLFYLVDRLKGGRIKHQIKEIELCINHPNTDKAIKIRSENLQRLLTHAVKTTPYYKTANSTNGILGFPVIRKTIIQNDFELFQSSEFKDKDNFKVSTSGSTGVPFFLFQDQGKRNRNHADVIYFSLYFRFTQKSPLKTTTLLLVIVDHAD